MKNISEVHPATPVQFLLGEHGIGGFRDKSDLETGKYHVHKSIFFAIDFFKNFEGSMEEKIELLQKSLLEIEKFHGTENNIPTE